MDAQIVTFSDKGLTTEVHSEEGITSIFFFYNVQKSEYIRVFCRRDHLENLHEQIRIALNQIQSHAV